MFNVPHFFSGDKFCLSDHFEQEVPINCHEINEGMKGTDPEQTDFPSSSDLRKRLKDRLIKRFNEKDFYFEDDDTGSDNEGDSADVVESERTHAMDEDWTDCVETQDTGKDFKHKKKIVQSLANMVLLSFG